tara:strand:+ start:683 stop:886 length:204 start_codon:yes stop_codon:yes gene_type:complete
MFNKVNINSETDKSLSTSNKINSKKRVDINVLLNRVRADKKKEKLESSIFFGIISLTVILVGVIISL